MNSGILNDIDGHIFRNVGGFYEKYFDSEDVRSVLASAQCQEIIGHDTLLKADLPNKTNSGDLSSWLNHLPALKDLRWHHVSYEIPEIPTMLLQRTTGCDQLNQAAFVRAIGIIMPPEVRLYRKGFAQLCVAASNVFAEDPLRTFIHAFMVWGTAVELWIIDRSGVYSCKPFDITSERFCRVMNVYYLLCEDQLGANTYLQSSEYGNTVFSDGDTGPDSVAKIYLDDQPLTINGFFPFINDVPTIYFASRAPLTKSDMVVKFKWRRESECGEGRVFRSMDGPAPRGVVSLYHAEDIVSTSSLRSAPEFGTAVRLCDEETINLSSVDGSPPLPRCFVERDPKLSRNPPYINRILSCIATFPKGIELHEYQSPVQAIEAFRDAINGHQALYKKHHLVHRDISIFNILLTDTSQAKIEDLPRGFLIDLEGALDVRVNSKRNQIVGTVTFMAVQVLFGKTPQTYRTDLESFFYSLTWFCIQPGSTKIRPPERSRLWRWKGGDDVELARTKLLDMTENEFHPDFRRFRSLVEGLRKLLFPVQSDGTLWTDTDHTEEGTESLYRDIIQQFDKAIAA